MTSIVLAGGKSLRLGRSKALERIGGQTLIERVISRLSMLETEIILVTADSSSPLPELGLERVFDVFPGKGALGGIYSGLKAAPSFYCLVVGCDMPFLSLPMLRYMIGLSTDFDAVVPRVGGKLEPLHAIYSKNCLVPMEAELGLDRLKISSLFSSESFKAMRVRYIEDAEVEMFDPGHMSFFNINTEADLELAQKLVEKQKTI